MATYRVTVAVPVFDTWEEKVVTVEAESEQSAIEYVDQTMFGGMDAQVTEIEEV